MSRKPSIAVQLLTAQQLVEQLQNKVLDLEAQIAELKKKAETDKTALAARYDDKQKFAAELEQVHQLLDAVPGAPARKSGDETTASWDRVDRTLMTRLAAWLATRSVGHP